MTRWERDLRDDYGFWPKQLGVGVVISLVGRAEGQALLEGMGMNWNQDSNVGAC